MVPLKTIQIVSTPDVLGGKPRIEGRRISVQHIVETYLHGGMGLEEMKEAFDISPAEIYAALSYYYLNQEEIEESLREKYEVWDAGALEQQRIVELLKKGLTVMQAAGRLGVTERAVRKLIESGTLPAEKIGDRWYIDPSDLESDEVKNRRRGRPAKK